MTITFVATGSSASGTDTITPAYPAGAAAGQLAVLTVSSGADSDPIPSTPSGWSLAGSLSGGGGTFGSGTGPRRLTAFVRELGGGDTAPTTSIPTGLTGSVIGGEIWTLSRSAGTGWRWAFTAGEDTTSGTAFSAAGAGGLTFAAGDFVAACYSLALSTSSIGSESITAAGVTFGTFTHQINVSLVDGDGARLGMAWAMVTTGASTPTPTVTATLSAATTGVGGVLRVREASSDVNASAQTADPPRNLVSATGLLADDIVTATLYRQNGATLTAVRAASDVDVTGADTLLRVDAEQPFGVSVNYAAYLTDVNGLQWIVYSGPITSTVTSDILSDAIRGVGAHIHIEDWADKKRSRDATVHNVNGRLVVVGKKRSAAQATITVSTDTTTDGDTLQDVLDGATEGTLQIRAQTSYDGVDGYLALISDDERRNWQIPFRYWDLETAETEAWADILEAAGFTLQDAANNFATFQDAADFFATYLEAAQYDFGS